MADLIYTLIPIAGFGGFIVYGYVSMMREAARTESAKVARVFRVLAPVNVVVQLALAAAAVYFL